MHTTLHPRRRASWRQHFVAVARAFEAGVAPVKTGMRPGLKAVAGAVGAAAKGTVGCAPSHS
ncbi:MAG TPA: hypothetical protein VFE23_16540 [Usitatibacter sp.]|jgi:hypothetical protein|nr:hypothetical protein [Usitatibacter sp.]